LPRSLDRHIDQEELDALVPWSALTRQEHGLSIREAEHHVSLCEECGGKLAKYHRLVDQLSNVVVSEVAPPGADCPIDIDWYDLAAGACPELKARQLITHAAVCDHCGPLLRAATSLDQPPTPQEEKRLAELKVASRPDVSARPVPPPPQPWRFMRWLVPAVVPILIVAALVTWWLSSLPLSGAKFAEFAVSTHRQHAQGNLALEVHSDSQQLLNEWFAAKSPFSLALPASPAAPGEERPYRLEGARMVQVAGKPAVYIAYQMQTGPASLVVTTDSVAVASGGVQATYKKVTFHYRMVEGYKVVTWSLHGRTYALVSQEGNNTQQSCMVCHSPMRDRDLGQTPTPLRIQPVLQ
jgi:anti-sigma factor RsiW